MTYLQKEINISNYPRGFHLITDKIFSEFSELIKINKGILQVFIKHTSASLTLNEDADPTVRSDFESHFNNIVPEDQSYYTHIIEGPDDMPAHLKASILGSSIQIPITNGQLNLGTWQGIYLCEHRNYGGNRMLVLTIYDGS